MDANGYILIDGPLYLDPDARGTSHDTPPAFDDAWVESVLSALTHFAADVPRWLARVRHDTLALRLALGEGFVDLDVLDSDALPPNAHAPLSRFIRAVTEASLTKRRALWCDAENHLGGRIATRLAERSRDAVAPFVRFLECNDLDHEVNQHDHIARVLGAHGWCPETLGLWVARLGTCAGQSGHETEWGEIVEQPLAAYLAADRDRRALLIALLAGNMVAQLHHLSRGVEHALAEFEDNLQVFWSDLDRQGLGESAAAIVAEAQALAEASIRTSVGRGARPHWLTGE